MVKPATSINDFHSVLSEVGHLLWLTVLDVGVREATLAASVRSPSKESAISGDSEGVVVSEADMFELDVLVVILDLLELLRHSVALALAKKTLLALAHGE